ncbi:ABC transporter permease [Pseudooceanicola sp. C21-150M6]|uniref:ABC transporter permease n=1 Tax=Pseudooceanicola sp. C21-150M6 TaxID=3434355 RepID=UPI003D7FE16A
MTTSEIPPAAEPGAGVARGFRTGRVVLALMLREMASRYGRSPGGYLWAILEPVGAIAVMALGFSLLVRTPPLGTSFLLFFATGFIPFSLYQNLATSVSKSINFSRALLTYPVVSWIDAILARFLLNSLTAIMVSYLILLGIMPLSDSPVAIDYVPVLETMLMAMGLGLAVGTINCALTGLIQIWGQVWSIVTRPLFIASGIFFLYDDLSETAQSVLWYNPLVHLVGWMRTGFYPNYEAPYFSGLYVLGCTFVLLFLGIVLLGRYHRDILAN